MMNEEKLKRYTIKGNLIFSIEPTEIIAFSGEQAVVIYNKLFEENKIPCNKRDPDFEAIIEKEEIMENN